MKIKNIVKIIEEYNLGEYSEEVYFKDITTLKVGGKIRLVFYPSSMENFIFLYRKIIKESIIGLDDIFIIGAGSNVLASDDFFSGLVISFKKLPIKYVIINDMVMCYPQTKVTELSNKLCKKGIGGAEFLNGLPATIGGAVYMNAGGFGKEIGNYVQNVTMLDKDGNLKEYTKEEMMFNYRTSLAKEKGMIILSVKLKFHKENIKKVEEKIKAIRGLRKANQPQGALSAGCAFQNQPNIKAWELIEKANLRGYKINDAMVSNIHCNFIVNTGNAEAKDLYNLQEYVKNKVYEKTKVKLINEWIIINFPKVDK